jgi:hypothetical protein
MDEKSESEEITAELRVPNRAWTDGGEDISNAINGVVSVFNELIDHKNFSGAAITFVLHKLSEVYVKSMFREFAGDDSSRSSIYVMTAQMMNANMDLYDEIRAQMPQHILQLIEEPTQGDA